MAHPPSTLGLSKFYVNKCFVKRGLSEYEPYSITPLLKTPQSWEEKPSSRPGPPSLPHVSGLLLPLCLRICCAVCLEHPAHMCTQPALLMGQVSALTGSTAAHQAFSILSPCSIITYVYLCGARLFINARASWGSPVSPWP